MFAGTRTHLVVDRTDPALQYDRLHDPARWSITVNGVTRVACTRLDHSICRERATMPLAIGTAYGKSFPVAATEPSSVAETPFCLTCARTMS